MSPYDPRDPYGPDDDLEARIRQDCERSQVPRYIEDPAALDWMADQFAADPWADDPQARGA
jgi:hypothetical protein